MTHPNPGASTYAFWAPDPEPLVHGSHEPGGVMRSPRTLDYWVATEDGRLPGGPYLSARAALANGHSLGLEGLWWAECEFP